jgi:hypothetical protein
MEFVSGQTLDPCRDQAHNDDKRPRIKRREAWRACEPSATIAYSFREYDGQWFFFVSVILAFIIEPEANVIIAACVTFWQETDLGIKHLKKHIDLVSRGPKPRSSKRICACIAIWGCRRFVRLC